MLLHKSVEFDSRVRREAKALAGAGHDVTVVHLAPPNVSDRIAHDGYRVASALPRAALLRRAPFKLHRLAFLAAFTAAIRRLRPDVVHAHDAAMLAPGFAGARLIGARLLYDSHELATGVPYRKRLWASFVRALERTLIGRCDAVITVSDGIAERLHERYGLRERPTVVRNLPDVAGQAVNGGLRSRLRIDDAPLVLHQGAPARSRGCEQLVRAIAMVPDAHLAFLGDEGDPGYAARLAAVAAARGVAHRVHFLPSIPVHQLLGHTSEADVGVSLLEDNCDNHRLALPNKVFEYVAAGVPVVVSALPELDRLVREWGVGWTADPSSPRDVARALRQALAERDDRALCANLARAASSLTWSRERDTLIELYRRLESGDRRQR